MQQSLNLEKGQSLNLSKEATKDAAGLQQIRCGMGWVGKYGTVDLDAFIAVRKTDGTFDFLYFGKKTLPGLLHHGDDLVGGGRATDPNEIMDIDLSKQAANTEALIVGVGIWSGAEGMKDVRNSFINVVDMNSSKEMCRFVMSDEFPDAKGVIAAEIVRTPDGWNLITKGTGLALDLDNIRKHYLGQRPNQSPAQVLRNSNSITDVQPQPKKSFFKRLFNLD